jgi:hypothetical protein
MLLYKGNIAIIVFVGRINHVQGTRPNADSAFAEYILYAHTRT